MIPAKQIAILYCSVGSVASPISVMKRILLIEDDPEMMHLTTEILQMANYEVLTADNGKKGVEIAFRERPDLIISDIQMPLLDGYGVLHLLNRNPHFAVTPFILVSEKVNWDEARHAMELGADDYISKPINETELLHAIECRLRKAEEIRNEYVQQRKASAFGEEIAESEVLNAFLRERNIDRYNRKQKIYLEGQRPTKLFYVLKGKVKLTKSSDEGKELVVELCGEGDFLGYSALLEDTVYKESAETMDFTELAVIPRKEFEELIHNDARIARRFIRMLANSISEKETKLVRIAYNSLRKKVADALVNLRKKYSPAHQEDFSINLHRDDLAKIAGTATESLIRTLSDFKSEQLIDIARDGTITLLNEKRLAGMLN